MRTAAATVQKPCSARARSKEAPGSAARVTSRRAPARWAASAQCLD
eukprot:CAMPEP_0167780710 /NCGR_PEP_ID=MMETSP0111_2-20121227/5517_1 /TAXON_ID=91324 /ORGANISM="Lotharella globosa, Strain CCCM811" /LENGTH=45 /DNA_ID= /DNA_START= /DNA_END= /DNA_ORIENTATION=